MVSSTSVVLPSDQGTVPTLVYVPSEEGRHPAVVLSTEAFGINDFTRHVASELAGQGYVVVVPDYYRGHGLSDPESYTDFSEVMEFIERLDFTQGTHDVLAAVDYARARPDVDPARVAVWGYCTGGTLALLAAALDRQLAAAVLFFPSQPTFPELNAKRPVQPIDLLWNVACPVLLIVGEEDQLLFGMLPEFRRRFEQWHVEHEIKTYEGAGHAFSAPVPPLRNDAADKASWADALAFAARHLG
ncbi:MAG TPA: dienelactone hydrolase family protein [Acidimicrobiales bacterium]|jgi:carboxymethylenebutenolidase